LTNAWNDVKAGAAQVWNDIKEEDLFSLGVNTPFGGGSVSWKKAAELGLLTNAWNDVKAGASQVWNDIKEEDLVNIGVTTPFGGGSVSWKKASEDLGIGSWFSCLGTGLATAAACTAGEVMTAGADTLVCAAGVAGTGAACADAMGVEEEEYM
jgi:hypothetical protein